MADNLNIKNPSVLPGDLDLRTDDQGYITSISGHPIAGGGGGGGITYYGDDEYIQYKNDTINTFTVTDKVKDVVDNFTENVSVLIDAQTYNKSSIDTMVSAKQDKLVFSGYENKIETINGSGFIVNGYVTTEAYQIDKINYNKKINDLSASVSSKQDKLTFEYDEDNKVSAINGSALATNLDLDDYYKKTETSSKQEISAAIVNLLAKPTGLSDDQYYAYTTSGWEIIQGAGDVSGISTVSHDDTLTGNGNQEQLGVDFTQVQSKLTDAQIQNISDVTTLKTASSTWDNVSAKVNTSDFNTYTATTAPNTYQPKGDYYSTNNPSGFITETQLAVVSGEIESDLETVSGELKELIPDTSDMATKTWVEGKHYLISDDISSKADKTQLDEYLTTAKYQTDSATFVTSSNGAISAAGEKYALTTTGWSKIDAGQSLDAGSGISIDYNKINVKLGDNLKFLSSNNTVITTEDNLSASSFGVYTSENYYTKIDKNSITKYYKSGDEIDTISLNSIGLETIFTGHNRNISANYDVNHLFFKSYDNNGEYSGNYSQIEMKVLQEQNPAATQHKSTIVLTDYDGTSIKTGLIDVASISAWNAATGGSFGGVITDNTLTGNGTDANNKLGVAWSSLSSYTIDYSNSAYNLTNGTTVSSFNQISAAIDNKVNKTLSLNIGNSNTVVDDGKCVVIGNRSYVSGNSFAVCDDNTAKDNSFAFGWGSSAKLYSLAGGYHCSADTYSISLSQENIATGHSFTIGHANTAYNYAGAIGRGLSIDGGDYGALAVGRWNNISSNALFVVGNGSAVNGRSDAFVVDRAGNTKIYGSLTVDVSSGKNVLAVASDATLIGASRQTSAHYGVDTTALGTTWIGVGRDGMHQGFIKYTDGGDVGALNTNNTIQINIKPENAGYNGEMTITNVNGETTTQSKVVNVPTASYNSMTTFDPTNGPNYMLRKTASGFDIGAKVVNVTSMPSNTDANTYYFVYEV